MKTLLVRPGSEIVEKTIKGPWAPELSYIKNLYREPGIVFRGFVSRQSLSNASTLAVGTILRKMGENVEYLDVPFEFGIPLTEELITKRNEKIEEYIKRGGYDIVGISCSGSFECVATQKIAEAAKRALKDVKVILGGYQATSNAIEIMEKIPAVDIIVLGDFEPISRQLFLSFNGKIPIDNIPNLVYRKKDGIHITERKYFKINPEDLLAFDYSLIKEYLSKYTAFYIEASRGCLYNCSFCQEKVLRKSYTVKNAAVAVEEIIDAANYIGQFVEPILFGYCDPLWGAKSKWVEDFCSELVDRKDEIISDKFGWGVEARVGQFTDEELSLMKKAGCLSIAYGVESLSPKMLKIMNKTRNPRKYINSVFETVNKTSEEGIHAILFYILGFPGETPQTIQETLDIAKKLSLKNENVHMEFGLAYSIPSTALDKQIHDHLFVEEHGVKIRDEYTWEKAYIPRFTILFDPSKELSAPELTDIFLNIVRGSLGISTPLEKQLEGFKEIKEIIDKDEISPEELAKWGRTYTKIVTEN